MTGRNAALDLSLQVCTSSMLSGLENNNRHTHKLEIKISVCFYLLSACWSLAEDRLSLL